MASPHCSYPGTATAAQAWEPCENLTVVQEKPNFAHQAWQQHKPTATIQPTANSPSSSQKPFFVKRSSNVGVQTDYVALDMSVLLDIEEMARTQRGLTSPSCKPRLALKPSKSSGNLATPESLLVGACPDIEHLPDVVKQHIAYLEEALQVQCKVNGDLKRLLVSALAGNTSHAELLASLTSDNAILSSASNHLAAQQADLVEAADSAGIAADVWRAKCLASRVVATEAARQAEAARHQVNLVRHALAVLLGERARLRLEVGQALARLVATTTTGTPVDQVDELLGYSRDTLDLAVRCNRLASRYGGGDGDQNAGQVLCRGNTPGEELALKVLSGSLANAESRVDNDVDIDDVGHLLVSPTPVDTESLVHQAVDSFNSLRSRERQSQLQFPPACPGCQGEVLTV